MRRFALLMLAATVACSGGSDSVPGPLPPTPKISASLASATMTAERGSEAKTTVSVARDGYAGPLTLSAAGAPRGVSITFSPATLSASDTSAVATIVVGVDVAEGTYPITVTAGGTGVASATATVPLSITARTVRANVNWTFCNANYVPMWLAYQNGIDGAWTRVTPNGTVAKNYAFTIDSLGAVAYAVKFPSGGVGVFVQYMSSPPGTYTPPRECPPPATTKTLRGTVAGLGIGHTGLIFVGGGGATTTENGPVAIENVADGTTDLIAYRASVDSETFNPLIERMIVRRNVNFATDVSPTLDFGGGDSFAPVSVPYTIANTNDEPFSVYAEFMSAGGTTNQIFMQNSYLSGSATVVGVPRSATVAGDFHQVRVSAGNRTVEQYNRDLAARTLTLGAPMDRPIVTALNSSPYTRFVASGKWQADYEDFVNVEFAHAGSGDKRWTFYLPRTYTGATAATWTITVPDFSRVAGFDSAWGLGSGPFRVSFEGTAVRQLSARPGEWPSEGYLQRRASGSMIVP